MNPLRVGITGQIGFIGYHLWHHLQRRPDQFELIPSEDAFFSNPGRLKEFVASCDAVVHLAAMNRGDETELYATNIRLVQQLLEAADTSGHRPHLLFSSSIQESLDNPYGRSKLAGKTILEEWGAQKGARVTTFVIPNVFGPFCRPRYNSFVATFCHQLTHGEEPTVLVDNNVPLIYINDLTEYVRATLIDPPSTMITTLQVPAGGVRKVTHLRDQLRDFRDTYVSTGMIPALADPFDVALFNTFRSYLEPQHYPVRLKVNRDDRGYLCETVKSRTEGQTFFSVTKPGITRGNHYHLRKVERFTVVQGEAKICLRKIGTGEVIEYRVSGEMPSFVDMPVHYTHNIQNIGSSDLLTLFWSNEVFNPSDPDTYPEKV